ncbi:hypothetical protein SAMN05421868_14031 [Paenibacillus naphthalenovorans]|nr:hypothetical protein SAMN05421868_14031 [Paenibacillus naphthalenovorans]
MREISLSKTIRTYESLMTLRFPDVRSLQRASQNVPFGEIASHDTKPMGFKRLFLMQYFFVSSVSDKEHC